MTTSSSPYQQRTAIDELVTQRELLASKAVRLSLIDYLVLQIVYEWNVLERANPLNRMGGRARGRPMGWDEGDLTASQPGAKLHALTVLTAGQLVREGFPLELALRFQNPDLPGLDIVSSAPIDDAIKTLIAAKCLAAPDHSTPHYMLTLDGDFILQRANNRMNEYEELFLRMPPIFFAAADLISYNSREAPKNRLRNRISETARCFYERPSADLRLALINLGMRLIVDESAPRGYLFHKKFHDLVQPHSRSGTELRNAVRRLSLS